MALFDRLSEMAKNLGDKTNDAIEMTKLNNKISAEKSAADAELRKIGAVYYDRYLQTGETEAEILEFCQTAKAHYEAAEAAQSEIERIRTENEPPPQPVAPVVPVTPAAPAGGATCPSCGVANAPGTKFCCACGTKLEEPAVPQPRTCPSCGTAVADGLRFCGECGTKLD